MRLLATGGHGEDESEHEAIDVTVEDNRVSRSTLGVGSYGIRTSGNRAVLSRNNVAAFSACFDMSTSTRYRENTTNGCTHT